jgi:hypothetical protein
MELTPGERAILNHLRHLYAGSSYRAHPMTAVTSQWPALHYEAYRSSFAGLVGKKLVQAEANGQLVRLTDVGFRALGLPLPPAPPAIKPATAKAPQPQAPAPGAKPKSSWLFWR